MTRMSPSNPATDFANGFSAHSEENGNFFLKHAFLAHEVYFRDLRGIELHMRGSISQDRIHTILPSGATNQVIGVHARPLITDMSTFGFWPSFIRQFESESSRADITTVEPVHTISVFVESSGPEPAPRIGLRTDLAPKSVVPVDFHE